MAECNFEVAVGCEGSESEQLYKSVEISVELHAEKLSKFTQQMTALLGRAAMPFIIIQYPSLQFENHQAFLFPEDSFDQGASKSLNKLYQWAHFHDKSSIKLAKIIEKQFQKITQLNNSLHLKCKFYDLGKEKYEKKINVLNGSKLKGSLVGDAHLVESLTEIIRRISVEFLNSPIMAFLEIIQTLAFKLDFEKVDTFSEEVQSTLLSLLQFLEKWVNQKELPQLSAREGDLVLYITIPKLFCIKIKAEVATVGLFFSSF